MLFSQPWTKKMLGKCGAACQKSKPALGTIGDEAGKLPWQAGTSWDFHDSLGNFHDKHPPIWKHCSKRSKPFFQGFHKINLVARNPNEVKSHPHREVNCQIQFLRIWFPSKNHEMTVFFFFSKQRQLANDATSSVYDQYLRCILSITCLVNHFSAFLIGWSERNAVFSFFNESVTDRPPDGRTDG